MGGSRVRIPSRPQNKPGSHSPFDQLTQFPLYFARALAYLPQQTPAASGMLVKELVALGRYPWHGALGRFGPADRMKVEKAIEQTGLGALADRLVDTLSGGERQRAWIAMLIMTVDVLQHIYGIEMALNLHPRTGRMTALPC